MGLGDFRPVVVSALILLVQPIIIYFTHPQRFSGEPEERESAEKNRLYKHQVFLTKTVLCVNMFRFVNITTDVVPRRYESEKMSL